MDDKKREAIVREAKGILDKFSRSLEGVKFKEKEFKKSAGGYRDEGEGNITDLEFKDRMFTNAPYVESDFIIAEKKKW